jgi:hypothetical protein
MRASVLKTADNLVIKANLSHAIKWLNQSAALLKKLSDELTDNRTEFQQRAATLPVEEKDWPGFLHRQWLKQSAKALANHEPFKRHI